MIEETPQPPRAPLTPLLEARSSGVWRGWRGRVRGGEVGVGGL